MTIHAMVAAGAMCLAGAAANAVVIDFQTANQYADNFRKWSGSGTAHTITQTVHTSPNVSVKVDRTNSGNALVALYDTTPANSTDAWQTFAGPVTVTFDGFTNTANSSFGIIFVNSATTGADKNTLALLNFDASSTSESFRIFVGASMDGSAAGTQVGSTQNLNVAALSAYKTISATYAPAARTVSLTVGGNTYTQTLSVAERDAIGSSVGVALRVYDANTSTSNYSYFDNVTIVPEPASLGLLSLAALPLLRRRRA